MSLPTYEMIDFSAPLAADIKESENSVFVKGFASVETPDRQNQFAPASEFNIETFLNTGTLLRDHKFIKDNYGNGKSAGVVREAEAAFISDKVGDEFIVSSSNSLEEINRVPVKKFPDLKVGSRGLFVVAEVIHPMAKEEVINGQLGAFSWRGLAQIVKGSDIGKEYDLIKTIDLKELSLVHIPQNTSSVFMIGKSADFENEDYVPSEIIKFKLAKSFYPNIETAKSYLRSRGIEYTSMTENETDFFAVVQDQANYDVTKSYLVKLGDVSVVTACRLDNDSCNAEPVGDLNDTPVKDNTVSEKTQVAKSLRVCFVDEGLLDKYFPSALKEVIKSEEFTGENGEAVSQELVQVKLSEEDFEALKATKEEPEASASESSPSEEAPEEAMAEETAEATTEEPAESTESNLVAQLVQMQNDFLKRFDAFEARLAEVKNEKDTIPEAELAESIKGEVIKEIATHFKLPLTSREQRKEVTKGDSAEKTDVELFGHLLF